MRLLDFIVAYSCLGGIVACIQALRDLDVRGNTRMEFSEMVGAFVAWPLFVLKFVLWLAYHIFIGVVEVLVGATRYVWRELTP